ncbi:MAG: hypothetical protein DRP37_08470, partial [Thermodesulfobacteriota bacterium]
PRPGTVAAAMNDNVPKKEKARRGRAVRDLGNEKKQAFYRFNVGKIFECLVEQQDKDTCMWKGFTPTYIPGLIETGRDQADLKNQILPVRITKAEKGMVLGTFNL